MSIDLERIYSNIQTISNTSKGFIDTSASPEKANLFGEKYMNSKELACQVRVNTKEAICFLDENLKTNFDRGIKVREFTEWLILLVNNQITDIGKENALRSWPNDERGYIKPEKIEEELDLFYAWFSKVIDIKSISIRSAAMIEKRYNGEIHPLTDGVGKVSILLATFLLLRNDHKLPSYRSRKEHYSMIGRSRKEWITYYETLFDRPQNQEGQAS